MVETGADEEVREADKAFVEGALILLRQSKEILVGSTWMRMRERGASCGTSATLIPVVHEARRALHRWADNSISIRSSLAAKTLSFNGCSRWLRRSSRIPFVIAMWRETSLISSDTSTESISTKRCWGSKQGSKYKDGSDSRKDGMDDKWAKSD